MSKSQFYSFYNALFIKSAPFKGQRHFVVSDITPYLKWIEKAVELGLITVRNNSVITFTRRGVAIGNKVKALLK